MPYRTELKRPDLKGQFSCSVCSKIFCHASSLSRHRMREHFKSYTCTQCNQEIPPDETLRSHMLKVHQISRMFMCRCCNWAFPDKTSLRIHMQSMSKHGHPGDVAVLARCFIEGDPLDIETLRQIMESYESSPDDDQDTDSPNSDKISSTSPSMACNNDNECTYPSNNELAALNLNMLLSNDGNGHFNEGQSHQPSGNSIFPSSNNRVELTKKSMQPRLFCSKCGLCDFMTINDLETHIVTRHFSSVNALYKCWFAHCNELFDTEVTRLQHMHNDPHVINRKTSINIKTLMQMPDKDFVSRRLAINSCLNESINLSFARCAESNDNNLQRPTAPNHIPGMKCVYYYSLPKTMPHTVQNEPSRKEGLNSPAHQSIPIKVIGRLENSGMNGKNNDRTAQRSCVKKVESRLVNVSVTAGPALSNIDFIDRSNQNTEPETSSSSSNNAHSYKEQAKSGGSVVKDEPIPIDELITATAVRPYHNDFICKTNETIGPEVPSSPFVIKNEPSLMDELAETIPVSSNNCQLHKQQAKNGGINSSRLSGNLISSTSASNLNESVNMSFATYAQSNGNNLQRLSKGDSEKKRTNPQTINLDRLDEPIKAAVESVARRTTAKPRLENSVLNGEQSKMNERKNLISSERHKHANSVVKEEAIDELTAATSVFESTASSPKTKRSRKQNFSDLYVEDYNSTQPRTSSSPRLRSKMNRV